MPRYIDVMKKLWRQWFEMEISGKYENFSFEKMVNKWFDTDILEQKN